MTIATGCPGRLMVLSVCLVNQVGRPLRYLLGHEIRAFTLDKLRFSKACRYLNPSREIAKAAQAQKLYGMTAGLQSPFWYKAELQAALIIIKRFSPSTIFKDLGSYGAHWSCTIDRQNIPHSRAVDMLQMYICSLGLKKTPVDRFNATP